MLWFYLHMARHESDGDKKISTRASYSAFINPSSSASSSYERCRVTRSCVKVLMDDLVARKLLAQRKQACSHLRCSGDHCLAARHLIHINIPNWHHASIAKHHGDTLRPKCVVSRQLCSLETIIKKGRRQ